MKKENHPVNIVLIRTGSSSLFQLFDSLVSLYQRKYQIQIDKGILKSSLKNGDNKEYNLQLMDIFTII